MIGRGSPKLTMMLSKAAQKKKSPKTGTPKKHGSSPREKLRASWNPTLERTLVDILHQHMSCNHKGQNGWPKEAWNSILKEFHEREEDVCFTRAQIQEKEKELKRDYNLIKEAKKQSGAHWNGNTGRITATPASHPKAKKFRNKAFPLFDALGELYDGQTAEGTCNYTSIKQPQHATHVETGGELSNKEAEIVDVEGIEVGHEEDEEGEENVHMTQRRDYGNAQMTETREDDTDQMLQRREDVPDLRRAAATAQSREEKEPKRQKKSSGLEVAMGGYIEMKKTS